VLGVVAAHLVRAEGLRHVGQFGESPGSRRAAPRSAPSRSASITLWIALSMKVAWRILYPKPRSRDSYAAWMENDVDMVVREANVEPTYGLGSIRMG
jgi:hypothetical protein